MQRLHPWKARFYTVGLMLILAFIGLIYTDVSREGGWNYWRTMVPLYILLSLWLSWYLKKDKEEFSWKHFGRECLQWVGLILSVILISVFVGVGLFGRFEAGLVILTLLGLTFFLAGVYGEPTFMIVGLVLGVFCSAVALMSAYMYSVVVPLTIITLIALFFILRRKKKPVDEPVDKEEM